MQDMRSPAHLPLVVERAVTVMLDKKVLFKRACLCDCFDIWVSRCVGVWVWVCGGLLFSFVIQFFLFAFVLFPTICTAISFRDASPLVAYSKRMFQRPICHLLIFRNRTEVPLSHFCIPSTPTTYLMLINFSRYVIANFLFGATIDFWKCPWTLSIIGLF